MGLREFTQTEDMQLRRLTDEQVRGSDNGIVDLQWTDTVKIRTRLVSRYYDGTSADAISRLVHLKA